MDNPIMNAALEYASRGWSVIPVSRTKQPLVKWKTSTREELTNPDNIREWWTKYPTANVAIVTGKRSGGLVVIDLDIDDQKGIDGRDSLQKWCDQNDMFCLESSATVETGRGVKHLYFQSDNSYHNQVGCLDGVDIRGEGGIVVAPPSMHGTTKREYIWDIDEDEVTVPKADSDVVYFLASMETKGNTPSGPVEKNDFTKVTKEGGRNNQLFKYLARLQKDGETDDAIREYAEIYNKTHLSPPLPDDEVARTVESVISHTEWKETPKEEKTLPQKSPRKLMSLKSAVELMAKDLPDPVVYVGVGDELPILVEGTCILAAKAKTGKSWFVLAMCLAVCEGKDFLGYKTKQCSTLYLDLETNEFLQQKRLRQALNGQPPPKNFYISSVAPSIENGLIDQVEAYLKEDPKIGVIVIDVFQKVRTSPKNNSKENDYERAYKDIGPLNELANKHHISIILVTHLKKGENQDDPFDNIIGSSGQQGAATQMIVMTKQRKKGPAPIHVNVIGKTIDGYPELDIKIENAQWSIVKSIDSDDQEQQELAEQYFSSNIRATVIKAVNTNGGKWCGRCSELIDIAVLNDIALVDTPKKIGLFLKQQQGRFLKEDGIKIYPKPNGTGGKVYVCERSTVDIVDNTDPVTVDDFVDPVKLGINEIPFL